MVSDPTPSPTTEAVPPRLPRLGAASSGLVALLLVGALFAIPLLGLLIAPLALLPVAHFQAGGRRGFRAWGPVVGLLGVASAAGMAAFALPLLAAYVLLVVLPAVSLEEWRLVALGRRTVVRPWRRLGPAIRVLVVVAVVAAPLTPMEAVGNWLRTAAMDASEMYAAWGLAEGEVELALDAAERMASWVRRPCS